MGWFSRKPKYDEADFRKLETLFVTKQISRSEFISRLEALPGMASGKMTYLIAQTSIKQQIFIRIVTENLQKLCRDELDSQAYRAPFLNVGLSESETDLMTADALAYREKYKRGELKLKPLRYDSHGMLEEDGAFI
jgi:hypothetical protein